MKRLTGRSSRGRAAAEWIARAAVSATLLLASVQATAYSFGAFGTWWLELLQYVPYPAYLFPSVAAFALSLMLGWRWRVAAALTVVLVITVVMGLVVGHRASGSDGVRMMTYNIKAYLAENRRGGFEAIAQEVAKHNPDILVMQDAGELMQRRLRAPETAASVFVGRYVYARGQYIVVSRYALRECRAADMAYRHTHAEYVRCIVSIEGLDVDLLTAHLVSPRHGLNATRHEPVEGLDDWQQNFADRLTQARELAVGLTPRSRPVILAGDLNASEESPVVRTLLAQGLRDAFSSAGRGYGYTLGHALRIGISFLRIDHILVSQEIGVKDAFSGGWQASEHRPVIADLLLQRGR